MTDHRADDTEKDQVAGEVAAVIVPDQGELDVSGEAVTEVLFAPEQAAESPSAAEPANDAPVEPAPTDEQPPADEPDPTAEPEADDGQDAPRRRRGRRRAASRPAGPPVFSAADEGDGPPPAPPRVQVPSTSMIAAVFQAPDPGVAATQAKDDSAPQGTSVSHPAGADTEGEGAHRAEEADGQTATDGESEADEPGDDQGKPRRRRRRGGRGGRNRKADAGDSEDVPESQESDAGEIEGGQQAADESVADTDGGPAEDDDATGSRRRRRRRRKGGGNGAESAEGADEAAEPRNGKQKTGRKKNADEVTSVKGSTRLEAKKQRRREGRSSRGSRAPILTEAEFLARRESVERQMVVRQRGELTQIAVLEDDVLVEHYVSSASSSSMIGNVYLGRVQNVLPSMEAAFVDIGRGRNAVLYAGEVNWDAAGLEGQPKRIELALSSGDTVLVQVTKDPVGHKGARLTSQISLPGRFLVYVPQGGMTGISRKLPDRERSRLKKILRDVVPDDAGVIVRTAAEGATEEQLAQDVERLAAEWQRISEQSKKGSSPSVLRAEPDLAIK
ncbi:MAG: ribonuclease E/G, partial [Candidatus Nanopelagicales bacterium]